MVRLRFVPYFVAVTAVGLTAGIKPPIEHLVGPGPPLLFFVPAVTIAAWVGGLWPGLLAVGLSSAICCYYLSPNGSFWVGNSNDRFRLLLFWLQGVMTSVLMELLRGSRRKSESYRDSLGRSEALNRALMDNAPAFIYIKDPEGRYLMTNRYYKGRFDNDGKPLVGLTDLEIHPRHQAEKCRADDRAVFTSGRPLQFEDIGRHADGQHTYLTVKFPLRDASGACYAVGGFSTDITERRRAEEALKESEGLLRCVTDTARLGLVVVDEGHRYLFANRAYCEILGISRVDIVGLRVADVLAPIYESEIRPRLDRAFRGERVTNELTLPSDDGKPEDTRSFTVAYEPHVVGLEASRVVVVIVDVTEQRRAEKSLKENEGRLNLFIDHAPAAIAMFDREMRYIAASRRWRFDHKLGKRDLIGRSHYDIVPDIPERWKAIHRQALSGEVVEADEDRFDRADGTVLWLRWEVRPWLNTAGELGGIVVAAEDITNRKHAEGVNARLAAIIDSSEDAIVGKDLKGVITSWNAAAERLFGYAADEAVGKPLALIIPRDHLGEELEILDQSLRGISVDHYETERLRKDGSLVDVSLTVSPVRDVTGRVIGVSKIVQDITERKRSEEARRESERMARSILNSISSHIAVLDESGTILGINRSWRLFAEANGLVGQINEGSNYLDVCDSTAGEDREMSKAFATGIREVLTGQRDLFELGYPSHSPSQPRWFIGRVTPFPNGGPRCVVVSHEDVTELKVAEEKLRESEWVLRQSQRMACVGSWELDLDDLSKIHAGALRWSDECFRIFGYKPGQVAVTNDLFVQAVHPDDRDAVSAALIRVLREHGSYAIEHRIVRPDGIERVVFEWGECINDPSGQPIRVLGTCQDITERKQTEIALQRYANRLEHLREIDRAILASHSHREVAEAALEHLARLVPYWSAGVTVLDFDQDEIEVIAARGLLGEWHPPGTRIHGELKAHPEIHAQQHGQITTEEDVRRADLHNPLLKALRASGMRSYLSIPIQDGGPPIGSLLLVSDSPAAFSADHFEVVREVADQLAIAIRQSLLLEDLHSARQRAHALARQLIRAEEDERRRIARELHDELGQALTALKINLQETIRGSDDRASRLEDSVAIVDVALRQVRGMALDLRPAILDDLGLVAALNWYVERHAQRTGLQGRFIADPDDIHADPEIETACFRVAQEALTNVARHARATRFSVELLQYSGGLQLVVRDDGIGFDPEAALRTASGGTSLGLVGMRDRVELVGGRIAFVSEPTGGTEVQVNFPNVPNLPRPIIERNDSGGLM
jgi:PAS domain S-box-containing protein